MHRGIFRQVHRLLRLLQNGQPAQQLGHSWAHGASPISDDNQNSRSLHHRASRGGGGGGGGEGQQRDVSNMCSKFGQSEDDSEVPLSCTFRRTLVMSGEGGCGPARRGIAEADPICLVACLPLFTALAAQQGDLRLS